MQKHPDRVVEKAILGMLPNNKLGRQIKRKLHVYAGPQHPTPPSSRFRTRSSRWPSDRNNRDRRDTEDHRGTPRSPRPDPGRPRPRRRGQASESFVIERPIQTVGRRKEAVVRVRLVPGTGKFDLDGRSLEAYFPNKVHQQLIKAPLVTVDRVESFDIFAHLHGGGPSGQAGALRLAIARALIMVSPRTGPR